MDYNVQCPKGESNVVELWSSKRLPFEPKGWLYDMRDSLIAAIKKMEINEDAFMRATYTSEVQELCDLENILLYNVGTGNFKKLCPRGFLLERSFHAAPYSPGGFNVYPHYQRYEITSSMQHPVFWNVEKVLASWEHILLDKMNANTKPHEYWKAIKENKVTIFTNEAYRGFFGLEIQISMPRRKSFNLASVVKALLDGIIAGFHVHDGQNTELVSNRLAEVLSVDSSFVTKLLLDRSMAVLGERKLLHPFQNNVQWNPADDKCVAIKITCQYNDERTKPSISGCLYAAKASNN